MRCLFFLVGLWRCVVKGELFFLFFAVGGLFDRWVFTKRIICWHLFVKAVTWHVAFFDCFLNRFYFYFFNLSICRNVLLSSWRFFTKLWFFFSRRVERILLRGKNKRGKTAGPLYSSLLSSLYSSPGIGFRPCTTKINRHFLFKKSAKISVSFKKFEIVPNCR